MAIKGEYIPKEETIKPEAAPPKPASPTIEGRLPAATTAETKPAVTGKGITKLGTGYNPNFETVEGPYSNVKNAPNFETVGEPYKKSYSKELATIENPAEKTFKRDPHLRESFSKAKQAGTERVAAARAASESATPMGMAEKVAKPGIVQSGKAALSGILSQAVPAQLAYELFQNPELKAQREAALQKGLSKINAPKDNTFGFPTEPSATTKKGTPSTAPVSKTPLPGGDVERAFPGGLPEKEKPEQRQFETSRVPPAQTISETAKAPEYTAEQVEEFSKGGTDQAVSKGKGGNFRYVIDVKGRPVKQNIDTGEIVPMAGGITRNIIKPGEEGPMAKSARLRKEKEQRAYHDALVQMATMPITGQTDIGDIAGIKARRKAALAMLGEEAANQRAAQQAGLEERQIGATERHALATEEANALERQRKIASDEAKAEREERRLGLYEQGLKAKANAPRTETFGKYTLKGTPKDIAAQKMQLSRQDYVKAKGKELADSFGEEEALTKAQGDYDNYLAKYLAAYGAAQQQGQTEDMKALSEQMRSKIGVSIDDYLQAQQ